MTGHLAVVEDVTVDDGPEMYLVRPEPGVEGPAGILYLHWFDESPNANRTQFLEEAKTMAQMGVVSLLPQLVFPWSSPPRDIEADLRRIDDEAASLRAATSVLSSAGVDLRRVALVGHDFGAMHGMSLFGEIRLAGAVLIAPTPRWSDWFLTFWPIESDRYDYMRALGAVDPITNVARADCPLLFQFGARDFYIAPMTGLELARAAPEPKQVLSYDSDHVMDLDEIQRDRLAFLDDVLGLEATS